METPSPDFLSDIYEEMMATGRALLIRPKPSRGLRPDDITDIKKFCMEGKD